MQIHHKIFCTFILRWGLTGQHSTCTKAYFNRKIQNWRQCCFYFAKDSNRNVARVSKHSKRLFLFVFIFHWIIRSSKLLPSAWAGELMSPAASRGSTLLSFTQNTEWNQDVEPIEKTVGGNFQHHGQRTKFYFICCNKDENTKTASPKNLQPSVQLMNNSESSFGGCSAPELTDNDEWLSCTNDWNNLGPK